MKRPTSDQAKVDLFGEAVVESDFTAKRQPFTGTHNPRHLRGLHQLLKTPLTREALDRVAGCSNAPDLVAELRRRGLDVQCQRVPAYDRDYRRVWKGVYSLTPSDRAKINKWLASNKRGGGNASS